MGNTESQNSQYYAYHILKGFSEIPAPEYPGKMLLSGSKVQPVFTGPQPEDVFLAAAEYGEGRVFVAAHDCYYTWMTEPTRELEAEFMTSVTIWLTKREDTENLNILDIVDATEDTDFNEYDLIKWQMNNDLTELKQKELFTYIQSGGALLAGCTPWAYKNVFPDRTLDNMTMYVFLKNIFGITFTTDFLHVAVTIPLDDNKATIDVVKISRITSARTGSAKPADQRIASAKQQTDRVSSAKQQNDRINSANQNKFAFNGFNNANSFYFTEILKGLTEIPTVNNTGTMIITDPKAQAVFTGEKTGDVFLAAAEHGKGRIFVATHYYYSSWFVNPSDKIKKDFINNVKKWLTKKSSVEQLSILDLKDSNESTTFGDYDIIQWDMLTVVSRDDQIKLLDYISNGGALMATALPWHYAQSKLGGKLTIDNMTLYQFLKEFFGIVFTYDYTKLEESTPVGKNDAKHGNLYEALFQLSTDLSKLKYYNSTIQAAVQFFKSANIEVNKELYKNMLSKVKSNSAFHPSKTNPIRGKENMEMCKLHLLYLMLAKGEKAPNVADFPGDFKSPPQLLKDLNLTLEANFKERVSTRYYAPAGTLISVKVISGDITNWKLRIGPHSDDLTTICELNEYLRWPVLTSIYDLKDQMEVSSPFGGLIYFESQEKGELNVILSNVVAAPYFDITDAETTVNWETSGKNAPGFWGEICGKHVIFTLPSERIRAIPDVQGLVEFWDSILEAHHKCRGSSPSEKPRERVVSDRQIMVGWMHAGYPIMTRLDCLEDSHEECIIKVDLLREKGAWGLFHEFGHNMQRPEWTFEGCTEVTVNIFTTHAMQHVIGIPTFQQPWILACKEKLVSFVSTTPQYDSWKQHPEVGLLTFVQLIKHFGWKPMYKFMSDYEHDLKSGTNLPKDNQEKIDQWVLRYSKLVNFNIAPQFALWGLPVSANAKAKLKSLTAWCPRDEMDPDTFYAST